jgi:hypothetical protein
MSIMPLIVPGPEQHQVEDAPARLRDGRQHEQRHRGRAGESMDDADPQRPRELVRPEVVKPMVAARERRAARVVTVRLGLVPVRVVGDKVPVGMHIACAPVLARRRGAIPAKLSKPSSTSITPTENSIVSPSRGGITTPKDDDRTSHGDDRQRVADSPDHPDQRRTADRAFAADVCRHGDHVIGVGGMSHAENESDPEDGEERAHGSWS